MGHGGALPGVALANALGKMGTRLGSSTKNLGPNFGPNLAIHNVTG